MTLFARFKHWLRRLFHKPSRDDILAGVSATPDHPDPVALIAWILMDYRIGVDRMACFALEQMERPFVTTVYENPVTLTVWYTPPFSPADRMKAVGLHLPVGFSVTHWERHKQFTLSGPKLAPHTLAEFINRLFITLYRPALPYVLAAWTEVSPTDTHHSNGPPPQQAMLI